MECAVPSNADSARQLLAGPVLLVMALLAGTTLGNDHLALQQLSHFPLLAAIGSIASRNGRPFSSDFDLTRSKGSQEETDRSRRELCALIVALDAMRDEEQRRLARDLHDDLGQLLGAMKLDLGWLERNIARDTQTEIHLARLHGLVDAMLGSVRRIIADLPPKDLEEFGLLSALERLVQNFAARHALRYELRFPPDFPATTHGCSAAAYRIVQEALNNVARHSAASRVGVQLEVLQATLRIRVADNGKGMRSEDEGREGSFGLIGMRERVTALGGQLQIRMRSGGGTVITAEIPFA